MANRKKVTEIIYRGLTDALDGKEIDDAIDLLQEIKREHPDYFQLSIVESYDWETSILVVRGTRYETPEERKKRVAKDKKQAQLKLARKKKKLKALEAECKKLEKEI